MNLVLRAAPLVLACVGLLAGPGLAQSVYGCSELEIANSHPSVEGDGGVFYRVDPDLRMFNTLSDESIEDLARLSTTLASLGTTLIYVPLPTKSLAMPDQLPQTARDFGFDVSLASSVYQETLERLAQKGVMTTDLRHALRASGKDLPSFFRTDYRMTSAGAQRAARAISDVLAKTPDFIALPKGRFDSQSAGSVTLPSDMRSALQRHCMVALPPVETEAFSTTRLQAGGVLNDTTLFGTGVTTGAGSARIALLGTEQSGEPAANLAGFLSEFSGLDVVQYAVNGGGSYGAISAYMTSRAFQEARPSYLVWVNPVENNLAQFGDQPLRELIAAAGDTCRVPLQLLSGGQANAVTADLSTLDPGQSYTLLLEADGAEAMSARFDFLSASGLVRSKSVFRNAAQVKTGRFYMPMSGLSAEGSQLVEIVLDAPFGNTARVTACFD